MMSRRLRKRLLKRGATVEKRGGGHWKVSKPGHQPVFLPSTSGGGRGDRNAMATLRREGYLPPDDR